MDSLPKELLSRICKDLHRGELWSLSLVSKKFARIATNFLYSNVELPVHEWNCQIRSARLFLRTLISTPTLCTLVKHIRVGNWQLDNVAAKNADLSDDAEWPFYHRTVKYTPDANVSPAELCNTVQSVLALDSLPAEHQDEFRLKLLDSSYDTITTAILCLVPNLKSFVLTMDSETSRYNAETGCNFNRLQTLKLIELSTDTLLADCNLFQELRHVWMDGHLPGEEGY